MTIEELAVELALSCDRCGHVQGGKICLRQKNHSGDHKYEPFTRVIPFG